MDGKLYELTNPQKNIWNTEFFYRGTSINNVCGIIEFENAIKLRFLEKALKTIIDNNDNFHLKFTIKNGSVFQMYDENISYSINTIQIKNEKALSRIEKARVSHVFDVFDSPLFDVTIYQYPNRRGGVIFNMHHLIADSWTIGMVANDLVSLYNSMLMGEAINYSNRNSYEDFIKAELDYKESKKYIEDGDFWSKYLESFPDLITIPKLSADSKSSDLDSKAKRKEFSIDKKLVDNLKAFCTTNNLTLFDFLMSVYSFYIGKINNSDDFILGMPILNRTSFIQKNTMGMFVSTIPFRVTIDENESFISFARRLNLNLMSIYRHQKFSYQDILETLRRNNSNVPNLYQVLLSYQITKIDEDKEKNNYDTNWVFNGNSNDDFDIHFFDINNTGNLSIAYDYRVNKYSEDDVVKMHKRMLYVISQLLSNPVIPIKEISITPPEELQAILGIISDNTTTYPRNKTIVDLFEEQVELNPDNVAIKYNESELTFKELNKKANAIAVLLRQKGIKPNEPVAIRINKSLEMVIGILGILKSGACYLPVDLSYPQERLEFMLADSNAKILLTNKAHAYDYKLEANIEKINIDLDNTKIYSNETDENPSKVNTPDDQIYIIYTSGSTGTPKGVILTHRNVVRLIKNSNFKFDFNDKDIWTMFHSMAFDFSVWELYGSLLYGGKLIIVPEMTGKDPAKFLELLRKEKVTVLNQTPTYFYNLLDRELLNDDADLKIRYIIYGGEALNPSLIRPWKNKYNFTKLINMYGITETTVHVTFKELSEDNLLSSDSNIGKPIPTLKVYVMDKYQHIMPFGVEGEMCVAGLGVSNGYLNRPQLTSEKFIKNPINSTEMLYRSADDAYLTEDGNLHYLGRIDNQVKIRGFRVEIGEIESKLLKHPAIKKCVVLPKENGNLDKFLVAYIVLKEEVTTKELKEYISKLVPTYMVPNFFKFIEKMPLTNNGKTDRKALLAMELESSKENIKYVAPRNEFEKIFANIIASNLGIDKVGIDDDLLGLGADSLALMKMTIELLEKDYVLNIQDIYELKTIRAISDNYKIAKQNTKKVNQNLYFNFKETFNKIKVPYNNVLLTGATGYLGIHILNSLIEHTSSEIYCIVRHKDNEEAKKRLYDKAEFYFGKKIIPLLEERVHVIMGDITLNKLGLSDIEYNSLGQRVNVVIHSAALVKHYGSNDMFTDINVLGTQNVIDFCTEFNAYLNHISTTSVAASIDNVNQPVIFDEHTLYIGQDYTSNIYIKTKFDAEHNIYKALNSTNLKASIYRLGNISARFSDGKFQENDDKNAFLNRVITLAKLDKMAASFAKLNIDISPVDICADAVVALSMLKSSYSKVFHIYNNEFIKLDKLINILKEENGQNKIEIVDDAEFFTYIKDKRNITGIINDLTSNASEYSNNILMTNTFTINALHNAGIEWKKIDKRYLLNFFKKYIGEKNA